MQDKNHKLLEDAKQIITVKEAKKLLGSKFSSVDNESVEDMITVLSLIARASVTPEFSSMKKGLIYVRVSSKEQVEGTSLVEQVRACQEFARKKDTVVTEDNIYREEGESAKVIHRTELQRLIKFATSKKNEVDVLYIWKIDRLARNLSDYYAIKVLLAQSNVKIISVTEPIDDDPVGRFLEAILAAAAQFDNEIRAIRTTGGMRARVEQGRWPHDAPIGYLKKNKRVVIDPVFGPIVKELVLTYSKGGYNYSDLANLAFEKGVMTKSGKKKTTDQMKRMVTNPIYAGFTVSKLSPTPVKGLHDALVDLDIIKKNTNIVNGVVKNYSVQGDDLFPLRGSLLCIICEKTMTGSAPTGSSGARFPRYGCNRSSCTVRATGRAVASKSIDIVHEDFRGLLRSLRPLDEGVGRLYKQLVLRVWNESFAKTTESISDIQKKIERAEKFKINITAKFINDQITEAERNLQMDGVDKELALLNQELENLSEYKERNEGLVDTAMEFISDPEKFWNRAATPVKKLVQQFLFPSGIAYDFETGFGTLEKIDSYLLINKISGKTAENTNLVAATRIELVTLGL